MHELEAHDTRLGLGGPIRDPIKVAGSQLVQVDIAANAAGNRALRRELMRDEAEPGRDARLMQPPVVGPVGGEPERIAREVVPPRRSGQVVGIGVENRPPADLLFDRLEERNRLIALGRFLLVVADGEEVAALEVEPLEEERRLLLRARAAALRRQVVVSADA